MAPLIKMALHVEEKKVIYMPLMNWFILDEQLNEQIQPNKMMFMGVVFLPTPEQIYWKYSNKNNKQSQAT